MHVECMSKTYVNQNSAIGKGMCVQKYGHVQTFNWELHGIKKHHSCRDNH